MLCHYRNSRRITLSSNSQRRRIADGHRGQAVLVVPFDW